MKEKRYRKIEVKTLEQWPSFSMMMNRMRMLTLAELA